MDAINSVQFSNHTGYSHIKGQVLDDSQLDDLVSGLELNDLLGVYSHLLTGYIGKDAFLRKIVDTVRKLRAANPNLIYGELFANIHPVDERFNFRLPSTPR